ncbi:uncharacterized protein LOC125156220 [Prionailurus viverrinus]|uniref:uncharacterized protein LOC125156220 n=1 Tax=Prionailurus viverrinus TaxID=61388 RepID=UPI001FF52CE5|nr:uncharacterized protein LOC125156220 [Prionailurus viverrinus]
MRGSGKWRHPAAPVTSIGTQSSRVSSRTPVLCLQLSSTPRFYAIRDQAVRLPGGTSLLSFISEGAVFPGPSLLRDCGFAPLRFSAGGSHQALAAGRSPSGRFRDRLLPTPRDCGRVPAPRRKKFPRSCSGSVSGTMESHNPHLAPGFTPSDLVPAPANVALLWGLLGPGGCAASTRCPPSRGTASASGKIALAAVRTDAGRPGRREFTQQQRPRFQPLSGIVPDPVIPQRNHLRHHLSCEAFYGLRISPPPHRLWSHSYLYFDCLFGCLFSPLDSGQQEYIMIHL